MPRQSAMSYPVSTVFAVSWFLQEANYMVNHHLVDSWGWVDWFWLFHCLPDSVWADDSLAEWADQLGKMGGSSKLKSTQLRSACWWFTLYHIARQLSWNKQVVFKENYLLKSSIVNRELSEIFPLRFIVKQCYRNTYSTMFMKIYLACFNKVMSTPLLFYRMYENYADTDKLTSSGLNRREWIQLNGCVFSPPFLAPVPGTRKRNLSIGSLPTALQPLGQHQNSLWAESANDPLRMACNNTLSIFYKRHREILTSCVS